MPKMIEITAAEYERLQECIREDGMRIAALIEENKALHQDAAHMIEEAQAVDAVPMTHDLNSSDLIRRNDVLWITKETGAWETQSRVRELPAVAAVPLEYHEKCMEAAIKKRILTEQTNRQIIENCAPVVHGRWRQDDEDAWTCTACGNMWTFLDGGPNENNANYCPMCGAKMNGEGDVE